MNLFFSPLDLIRPFSTFTPITFLQSIFRVHDQCWIPFAFIFLLRFFLMAKRTSLRPGYSKKMAGDIFSNKFFFTIFFFVWTIILITVLKLKISQMSGFFIWIKKCHTLELLTINKIYLRLSLRIFLIRRMDHSLFTQILNLWRTGWA